ncbi:hypothetical protein PUN28_012424 [Cardiocondyla obscurior]|uniref:Uncharacterized protein n=1 Tax=Cardiocondyla obscurior TaxID=286306 RepID=A0AAW2FDG7_9HYME
MLDSRLIRTRSYSCFENSPRNLTFAKLYSKNCKPTEIKKPDQFSQSCNEESSLEKSDEKNDVCSREKVKCDRSKEKAREKPKIGKMIVDHACKKTCLPAGKCELPQTVPPPKMEYAKVACPPQKFVKPNPCPSMSEDFRTDDKPYTEMKNSNVRKKKICAPPPLPKQPYAPVVLCPCSPPPKIHPGPCPYYEMKKIVKRPLIQPCKLKKTHPCPTVVHYCPSQKKPCNLKQDCEHRTKKEAPAS